MTQQLYIAGIPAGNHTVTVDTNKNKREQLKSDLIAMLQERITRGSMPEGVRRSLSNKVNKL